MKELLMVAVGSALGGLSRYGVAVWSFKKFGMNWPVGTFVVNLLGCFLLGLFDQVILRRWIDDPASRLLLITGFCGSFTTFSTLIWEASAMGSTGAFMKVGLYIVLSLIGGGILFYLGFSTGKIL